MHSAFLFFTTIFKICFLSSFGCRSILFFYIYQNANQLNKVDCKLMLTSRTRNQDKIKNQIRASTSKYNKSYIQKNHSLLAKNRLTKSYFSLHDTSLQNRSSLDKNKIYQQAKQKLSNIKRQNTVKLLERFNSQRVQTKLTNQQKIQQLYIPLIKLKKSHTISNTAISFKNKTNNFTYSRHNKFHLLFKDQHLRKSASERKNDRIDRKIQNIKIHNKFLQSLKPYSKPIIQEVKVLPRGIIVSQDRISKLSRALIKNVCLYFSMYSHPKKVGDILKACEGYNSTIHKIFFKNYSQVYEMKTEEQIEQFFWVFRPQQKRPQFFGEEDSNLFNVLQNYSLKLERSYGDIQKTFLQFQQKKMEESKKHIAKKLAINERKLKIDNQMNNIVHFIDHRRRHNQDRRQQSFRKLESLGVRFSIQERSKQLTIREKQKIMKSYLISNFK